MWYGETRFEKLKSAISPAAESAFKPLCVIEAEIRNRFFPKVNIER